MKEIAGNQAPDLINATDESGHTALHLACDQGHMGVAAWLCGHGADVNVQNCDGQTALHMACVCEHKMVVQVLMRKGASIEVVDNDGKTPLELDSPAVHCFASATWSSSSDCKAPRASMARSGT